MSRIKFDEEEDEPEIEQPLPSPKVLPEPPSKPEVIDKDILDIEEVDRGKKRKHKTSFMDSSDDSLSLRAQMKKKNVISQSF